MLDFDDLKDRITFFIYQRPVLARIAGIILLFFLVGMIILFIQSSKPKIAKFEKTDLILDAKPVAPAGPDIEKEYYLSRKTDDYWNDEEIKEWFTAPDGKMLKELEKSNDKIVSEITGAAP